MYKKYNNKPTMIGHLKFDSQKEAKRYLQLEALQSAGIIQNLTMQQRYLLAPAFRYNGKVERKIEYVADFAYIRDGKETVEDVKSPITRTNPVYRLKRKLLLYNYPEITFLET